MDIGKFTGAVHAFYRKEGRSFPWRGVSNPWGVLVSEFMLQQTRTERAVGYYNRFMERWPTPLALHEAAFEEMLREWSGLGYNRRARFLKDCAGIIATEKGGVVPSGLKELAALPGIGRYSAGAIACFAYNVPSVFIETNIRAAVLHFFFQDRREVRDSEIIPILEASLDRKDPRTWYYALMDYGAALKKRARNPGRKSAGYKRQSGFEGSFRQMRGSVMRALLAKGPGTPEEIFQNMDIRGEKEVLRRALEAMAKDRLVTEEAGVYRVREDEARVSGQASLA